jgi:hypothetical protein
MISNELILECGRLVQSAYAFYDKYDAPEYPEDWFAARGYTFFCFLTARPEGVGAEEEEFGFVLLRENHLFIVLRGTESFHDWLSDADLSVDGDSGVLAGVHALAGQIREALKSVLAGVAGHQDMDIVLTGHSLGGGIAVDLARKVLPAANGVCITFGAPKVLSVEGYERMAAAGLAERIYQVVNSFDEVPKLPDEPGLELRHIGDCLLFAADKGGVAANHAIETYVAAYQP